MCKDKEDTGYLNFKTIETLKVWYATPHLLYFMGGFNQGF